MDILHRIKSCLPLNTRITFFNSYVLPFDYTLCYKNMRLENVLKILEHSKKILRLRKGEELLFWISGEGERVCGSADLAKNSVRIADFNNNFSGSVDPINVMNSGLGKKIVRITDSKHNCS